MAGKTKSAEAQKPQTIVKPEPETAPAAEAGGISAAIAPKPGQSQNINALMNVSLKVQIVLGETKMPISQLLDITRGSVVELDKRIGEPVDMMINDRLVARGDLVKVGENRVGVNLTEITKSISDL